MHTEIEQIMGRQVYSGKVLYLTRWKGQSQQQATWESVKVLKNVKYLIKDYNKKHKIQVNIDEDFAEDQPVIKKKKEKIVNKVQPRKRGRPRKNNIAIQRQDIKIEKREQIFYQSESSDQTNRCSNQALEVAAKSISQCQEIKDNQQHHIQIQDIDKIGSTEQASLTEEKNIENIVEVKDEDDVTEKGALTACQEKQIVITKIIQVIKGQDGKAIYTIEDNFGIKKQETTENLLVKCPRLLISFLQNQLILKERGKLQINQQ